MKTFSNCTALINGQYRLVDIVTKGGYIVAVNDAAKQGANLSPCDNQAQRCHGNTVDVKGMTVLAGLTDIHTHGAAGYDFNTADTPAKLEKILDVYLAGGVTSVLATVTTDSINNINKSLSLIARYANNYPIIKGIHLEGPFLSRQYRGAQAEEYLVQPDYKLFEQFQQSAQGFIKLVTLAPELPNAAEFTRQAVKSGVKVSLGHSGASCEQAIRCLDEGASSFTHTFNALAPLDHHHPSLIAAALARDCYCEAICDGLHLHPQIVNMLHAVKGDRLIAVTDSIAATGLPDGQYSLAGQTITKCGGNVMLSDGKTRAGSVLTALEGLKNLANYCNQPLEKVIACATSTPCRLLGINAGEIAEGAKADFFVLCEGDVALTVINGEIAYSKPQ